MKKLIVLCSLVVALGFIGCTKTAPKPETKTPTATPADTEEKKDAAETPAADKPE
ncbi:MAG: hypothetical protein LBH00_11780 [Planctomycetaceae bacterium]|jgi:hypothetical protein|nr:hypothetical protein [Planctomycetaceae bacterium]